MINTLTITTMGTQGRRRGRFIVYCVLSWYRTRLGTVLMLCPLIGKQQQQQS